MVKVLDCTLRDGGYYNDWDFDVGTAADVVAALGAAGVDIVELGYRSLERNHYYGPFKYCDEEIVRSLLPLDGPRPELAFMLDAKEFAPDGRFKHELLKRVVRAANQSSFSWARVAAHPHQLGVAGEIAAVLKDWGYSTALNIMGVSALKADALHVALETAARTCVDVLYFADSYGSLTPSDTAEKVRVLREQFPRAIGVHMHENLGLALSNTLAALDGGVDFVDSTLAGMGRGAGNLRTEQLLLALYARYGRRDLNPSALLPVLRARMAPLHVEHGWGWDFPYMLSGLVGIHPTYCQALKTGARYTLEAVAAILEDIPAEKRPRFDENELLAAEMRFSAKKRVAIGEIPVTLPWEGTKTDDLVIIAGGPQARRHEPALRRFVERLQADVIECNDTGLLHSLKRQTIVMNGVRIQEMAQKPQAAGRTIVTPLASVPAALESQRTMRTSFALQHGAFDPDADEVVIPAFNVGMLAIALALRSKPKRIWLAGFDGFVGDDRRAEQNEMALFWSLVRAKSGSTEVVSLLPTEYDLATTSVYGLG